MDAEIRKITLKRHPFKDYSVQVGDTVKVHIKVKEGSKERVQTFEGVVLKTQGSDFSRSFTVRKVSAGVGVEKTIPFASPHLSRVEVVSQSKVRRARLFYLRNLKGRKARLDIKNTETSSSSSSPTPDSSPAE